MSVDSARSLAGGLFIGLLAGLLVAWALLAGLDIYAGTGSARSNQRPACPSGMACRYAPAPGPFGPGSRGGARRPPFSLPGQVQPSPGTGQQVNPGRSL